jgi:saccharopine dehydrogenase-like NADP-dependent oxidoreductase
MSKVLVLGVGLQGKAVVHDLATRHQLESIVVADLSRKQIVASLSGPLEKHLERVEVVEVDATNQQKLASLMADQKPDVVICMLPPLFGPSTARLAMDVGAHYVCTSYTGALTELDGLAREKGLAILPEMGLDPGIDLVLCRLAVDQLDEVHRLDSYGGGIPEPACADDNPLRYKITWTFEGVLGAYVRNAFLLENGQKRTIDGRQIFHPDTMHTQDFDDIGTLEAYPNGDALSFIETFDLGSSLRDMGRYSLRWPGHCATWYPLVQLGLLDEAPLDLGRGLTMSPRQFLAQHLEPMLRLEHDQRDLIVLRVRAVGLKAGVEKEVVLDVLDYRDLDTGLFAMNRTVGFTASIGAEMILKGDIQDRGVLSPARHVPPMTLIKALEARDIVVRT